MNNMGKQEEYQIEIREISFFRASEEVADAEVIKLAEVISSLQTWISPIPVERRTGIIMDGNHRWHAGMLLGLTHLPCLLLDYCDPRVRVYERGQDKVFDVEAIFRTVMAGKVLKYKTTRHVFSPTLPRTDIGLSRLAGPTRGFAAVGAG